MKSFSLACLMAASAFSLNIQSDKLDHPWYNEDTLDEIDADLDQYEEDFNAGEFVPVEHGRLITIGKSEESAKLEEILAAPIYNTNEEVASAVLEQVHEGFEKLSQDNKKAEVAEVEEIVTAKKVITEALVEEAKQEAVAVIDKEVEVDAEDALVDVAKAFVERAEKVGKIKKLAEEKVAEVIEVHQVTQQSNNKVENDLVEDIYVAAETGGDLDGLIQQAKLPFEVEVPSIDKTEDKLDRIVHRSGTQLGAIKEDPEFDDFLGRVIDELKDAKAPKTERPEFDSYNPLPDFEQQTGYHAGASEYLDFEPDHLSNLHTDHRPDFARVGRPGFANSDSFRIERSQFSEKPENTFSRPDFANSDHFRPERGQFSERPENSFSAPMRPNRVQGYMNGRPDHPQRQYETVEPVYEVREPETEEKEDFDSEKVEDSYYGPRSFGGPRSFRGPQSGPRDFRGPQSSPRSYRGPQFEQRGPSSNSGPRFHGGPSPRGYPGDRPSYDGPERRFREPESRPDAPQRPDIKEEDSYEQESYDEPQRQFRGPPRGHSGPSPRGYPGDRPRYGGPERQHRQPERRSEPMYERPDRSHSERPSPRRSNIDREELKRPDIRRPRYESRGHRFFDNDEDFDMGSYE